MSVKRPANDEPTTVPPEHRVLPSTYASAIFAAAVRDLLPKAKGRLLPERIRHHAELSERFAPLTEGEPVDVRNARADAVFIARMVATYIEWLDSLEGQEP